MGDYGLPITAIHGAIDNVAERLLFEHKQLNALTDELNKVLKRAVWVSQSNDSFNQVMAKYNLHMAELHHLLAKLAGALTAANQDLMETDRNVAAKFRPPG